MQEGSSGTERIRQHDDKAKRTKTSTPFFINCQNRRALLRRFLSLSLSRGERGDLLVRQSLRGDLKRSQSGEREREKQPSFSSFSFVQKVFVLSFALERLFHPRPLIEKKKGKYLLCNVFFFNAPVPNPHSRAKRNAQRNGRERESAPLCFI